MTRVDLDRKCDQIKYYSKEEEQNADVEKNITESRRRQTVCNQDADDRDPRAELRSDIGNRDQESADLVGDKAACVLNGMPALMGGHTDRCYRCAVVHALGQVQHFIFRRIIVGQGTGDLLYFHGIAIPEFAGQLVGLQDSLGDIPAGQVAAGFHFAVTLEC